MVKALSAILGISGDENLKVPPSIPYVWNKGNHDIELIKPNIPIIGMAYTHEDESPADVDQDDLEKARVAADDENASEATLRKYTELYVLDQVKKNFEQYSNWYLVLVACTQVRELTDSNIQNFSKMCGAAPIPARVKSFLAYWASQQVQLAAEPQVRERFEDNKFFEYHTMGSSTPGLCIQAMDETGGLSIFSDAEVSLVKAADELDHDLQTARLIPPITLVKTSAVLEAAGTLPEVWYMGTKAKEKFSGKKYTALVKFLKEIFKRQTQTEGLDDDDDATLFKKFQDLLLSFPAGDGSSNSGGNTTSGGGGGNSSGSNSGGGSGSGSGPTVSGSSTGGTGVTSATGGAKSTSGGSGKGGSSTTGQPPTTSATKSSSGTTPPANPPAPTPPVKPPAAPTPPVTPLPPSKPKGPPPSPPTPEMADV